MEDIVEVVLKFIGRALLFFFRSLVVILWAAIELNFVSVAWWLGWPFVRLVTIGRFPDEGFLEHDRATSLKLVGVGLMGIVYPVFFVFLLVKYLD